MESFSYYWVAKVIELGNAEPTRECAFVFAIPHEIPTLEDITAVKKALVEHENLSVKDVSSSVIMTFFARLSD